MPLTLVLQPWHLILLALAGWINREQQRRIHYLQTEVAVLKEHIGKKRILLTDDQRRRLAVQGKVRGRKALDEIGALFSPDTILRWHRQLVARKWDYSDQGLILFGERSLRNAMNTYLAHYHAERPHQGLNNQLVLPLESSPDMGAEIETAEHLGGLLRSYRRAA